MENEVLAGVVGVDLATKELDFAGNSQGRSLLGVLVAVSGCAHRWKVVVG